MNKIDKMIKKYMYGIIILLIISIILGITYSNYIVTSNNHKAAEIYIGQLKYLVEINGNNSNTLSVPSGETIIDVKINNLNSVDTYYKLLYLKNSNLSIEYYESAYELDDTNNITIIYDKPNSSIINNNSNNIKLKIINSSTSSQNLTLSVKGGYITNTVNDIITPSTHSEITLADTSANTYFCKTNASLTQGAEYINGQFIYKYMQDGQFNSTSTARTNLWKNIDSDGWGVQLNDKSSTEAVTSKLCTYINNKATISMSNIFTKSRSSSIDLTNFNTQNIIDMSFSFSNISGKITGLDNLNTKNVTNMNAMFNTCPATTLDLSSFDTSNVTNMKAMFNAAANLTTIYVSNKFTTNNVTSSNSMFTRCKKLVGGMGTTFDSTSELDKTYARIDGGEANPGYFTDIADKSSTFGTDDWATVISSVKAGNSRGYKVGETKEIDLGTTYGTHTIRIANTSTPSECSTTGFSQTACGFVLEFADIIITHTMNDTNTNVGGWPASSMYTFLNDIYKTLPEELESGGIIDTTVISGYGTKDTENFTSTDKLYLLSPAEIWTEATSSSNSIKNELMNMNTTLLAAPSSDQYRIIYDSASGVTRQLDYYKKLGVTDSNYSSAIKKNGTTADIWWLRAAHSEVGGYFFGVNAKGGLIIKGATGSFGVSPAFRIG